MSLSVKTVAVLIDRDMEHIATAVFAHEVPILEAAHGQGAVRVVRELAPRVIESVRDEHERLCGVYARRNADPVLGAYPGGFEQVQRAIEANVVDGRAAKAARAAAAPAQDAAA